MLKLAHKHMHVCSCKVTGIVKDCKVMVYMFQPREQDTNGDYMHPQAFPGMEEENVSGSWQIRPPIVTGGRMPAISMQETPPSLRPEMQYQQVRQPSPPAPQAENAPLFRLSFVGPDQQWYSVSARVSAGPTSAVAPVVQRSGQPEFIPLRAEPVQQEAVAPWSPRQERSASASVGQASSWHRDMRQGEPFADQYSYAPQPVFTAAMNPSWQKVEPDELEDADKSFLLQIIQPGLAGLMDGSVSTLAPIFAVAFATHRPFTVFLVGMASALGAGISMTFSEALSDDGEITGRGKPFLRGGVTGLMTFLSGAGHALPFLIPNIQIALLVAYGVVVLELLGIAAIRHKYFKTNWFLSIIQVVGGGALVFLAAILLGNA